MSVRNRVVPLGRAGVLDGAGAVLALVIAVTLFSRFSIDDTLSRDESVYAYSGQQVAAGVPFYVSIFEVKTPLAAYLAGLGAVAGKALGAGDLHGIRIMFFLCACLTVVAVYLLGLRLWRSALAGLAAAATFASFKGFAITALTGPQAKTPGILFAVLSMALVVRRRWFWGTFTGSLAFLVWQPLAIYPAVAVAAAWLTSEVGERRRHLGLALAGAVVPVAATTLYLGLVGALPQFLQAAFVFPVTGLQRTQETLSQRLAHIVTVVHDGYGPSHVLFWGGLVLLLALVVAHLVRGRSDLRQAVKHPLVCVVIPSFLAIAAFSAVDFQGYPDVYPALPYAAVGLGGAVGLAVSRSRLPALRWAATVVALGAVAALVGLSWSWDSEPPASEDGLVAQRADAAILQRILDPGDRLYALGDPTPLVLTRRRNPSRFIYLSSGVDEWVVSHTPGGFAGWTAQIRASDPAVIVVHDWHSPLAQRMGSWLRSTYDPAYAGSWRVFLKPGIRDRAKRRGIILRRPA